MLRVSGEACRRWARMSVQRSLPLVVAPWPSVMESPRAMTAAAPGVDCTSMAETWYQWSMCRGSQVPVATSPSTLNAASAQPAAGDAPFESTLAA